MSKGAKGLSLFIVPKDSFDGHEFEMTQPTGGKMLGKADRTLGYRGMHSFGLTLDDYFVPEANLVGGAEQEGRGFYLQMAGFAAGRLQTAGRATGVGQAAIETTARYVTERSQFNKPLIDFQLTQYKLGRMVARVAASRVMSYEAALQMDEDERAASGLAAQAKLLSCDIAVEVTQEGQLLHGGWGYAEEYAISRYVVDALVLPIFEGVKPVLELKVVARTLPREEEVVVPALHLRSAGDENLAKILTEDPELKPLIAKYAERERSEARRMLLGAAVRLTATMAPNLTQLVEDCRNALDIEDGRGGVRSS